MSVEFEKEELKPSYAGESSVFLKTIQSISHSYSMFESLKTVQVNLGNLCNLSCRHCHVDASPSGKNIMSHDTITSIVDFVRTRKDVVLDITGGAPEMNSHFKELIIATDDLGIRRIVRTNLVIASEPGMEWLPEFYRDHNLVLIASMPCYTEENVDYQRGRGVYDHSISILKKLNALGYGDTHELDLVYNPGGAALPGNQKSLEDDYRRELHDAFGIVFSNLFTITNIPIGRFRKGLQAEGSLERYEKTLSDNFNPCAVPGIMCRSLISIDWKGNLYNCDFNLALDMPIREENGRALNIRSLSSLLDRGINIQFGDHCFGCTAGEGSSCCGKTVS